MFGLGNALANLRHAKTRKAIAAFFDTGYYLSAYKDVRIAGLDPLDHYIQHGWKEGRDPSPDFSTVFYLTNNPEIQDGKTNPYEHYILVGRLEGRSTRAEGPNTKLRAAIEADFDTAFYRETYPDVAVSGIDALTHFIQTGWKEGRDPNAAFSTLGYLEANQDVKNANINPFWHYIVAGRNEGRVAMRVVVTGAPDPASAETNATPPAGEPSAKAEPDKKAKSNQQEKDLQLRTAFDEKHYLTINQDVARAGVDAFEHYMSTGWREGRDPSADFSSRFYLQDNPDVAASGQNPFEHFVLIGKNEGRAGKDERTYEVGMLQELMSPDEVAETWKEKPRAQEPADLATLRDDMRSHAVEAKRGLMVSFGHDDYLKSSGGVQLCIAREQVESVAAGFIYLNAFPLQPLPYLAREDDNDPLVCLILDGVERGTCRTSELTALIIEFAADGIAPHLVIHSLLGHSPEALTVLADVVKGNSVFWLHDYFSLCPSFTLQRNTVRYCGAPDVSSGACDICVFQDERRVHVKRIEALFTAFNFHVISPSRFTSELWKARSDLPHRDLSVTRHMRLQWTDKPEEPQPDDATRPLRVAFVGWPAPHKGWNVFRNLAAKFARTGQFEFYYFGVATQIPNLMKRVPVMVTRENYAAMTEALEREDIDILIHWSSWPETFSLSTYEALAANSFVITNAVSGNIADTVNRLKRGVVLGHHSDLIDFFQSGGATELGQQRRELRRSKSCRSAFSRMSVPTFTKKAAP